MGAGSTRGLTWQVALRLGRVSNLPTVWTNVLSGVALAGGAVMDPAVAGLMLAMSLLYIAGMYLNDAFDREIDAKERPERPIPSGTVTARGVFTIGFALMAAGVALVAALALLERGVAGWAAIALSLALCGTIVFYDMHHKQNPLSPVVMGICRVLVLLTAGFAFAVGGPLPALYVGAFVMLCWLIGLTYTAKQETLGRVKNLWPLVFLAAPLIYGPINGFASALGIAVWAVLTAWVLFALFLLRRRQPGDIPRAVVSLIAGISLVDALFLAEAGMPGVAIAALVAFLLTLVLQRVVPGT